MEQQRESELFNILVVADVVDGNISPVTFELLSAGKNLAAGRRASLCAALLGEGVAAMAVELAGFCGEVFVADHELLAGFQSDLFVNALEELCRSTSPDVVLLSQTLNNLDAGPRLAYRLDSQLMTDCISFELQPATGHLLCTKPVYGGNALAVFEMETKPFVVTLRPKSFAQAERNPEVGKITRFVPALEKSMLRTESVRVSLEDAVRLDQADAIVAGGRGLGKVEGLAVLRELMSVLSKHFDKVELGASRPVIDNGWLPSSRQLGLTGEKASPQLYIAVGISGASQHVSGISGSRKIVAVNKDPRAPIFASADYGVVGEYEKVIPALARKLKEL